MDKAAETSTEAVPPPPAQQPPESPRPPSAINVAMDDAPDYQAEGSDEDESMPMSPAPRESQDPVSGPGSVRSSNDPGLVKPEDGSVDTADAPMSTAPSALSAVSVPVQKRRRVTRACDECRRKKIKCDGRSPCTHCSVYSYECTYDKPSNRRRNPAPQYIEALENRLQRAEALLRKFLPDVNLADPKLDPTVQQEFANRERARAQAARLGRLVKEDASSSSSSLPQQQHRQPPQQAHQGQKQSGDGKAPQQQDAQLMSMIETIGHLDLIDGGEWDFHGGSSGAVFLRRLKEQMGLYNHDAKSPFLPRPPRPPGMFNLDSPRSSAGSPWEPSDVPAMYDLPPRDVTRSLCYYSLSCATCLLRIVHVPSFYEMVDRLYEKGPENLGPEDHRSLGLLYAVMALGSMYTSADDEAAPQVHYKTAIEKGVKYYSVARLLLQDITECRDLLSLQGLLFLILFLQATSNLSGCYAFLGIALRAALRMGLHRNLPHVQLTPIEDESRRRVFYVIRQMDTYVSALLGFPLLLRDEDIDQPLPTEVDDEYITKDTINPPPPDTPSFFQAVNAHVRLMRILSKVIHEIYPLRSVEECAVRDDRPNPTYMISYTRIAEIEQDLQQWSEELPAPWRPNQEGHIEAVRVRSLLRFAYAHVQMMLYRPFLHYVSPRLSRGKNVDERYYACARTCVNVSRNIIHIGMEIRKQAVLVGPYWFILYTEFFAILSLIFYALENPEEPDTADVLADAHAGREFIASLSKRSLAADRVTDGLNAMFEQLPDRIDMAKGETEARPVGTKKRAAASPVPIQPQPANPPQRKSEDPPAARSQSAGSASGPHRKPPPQPIPSRMPVEVAAQRRRANNPHPGLPQGHPGEAFMSNFGNPVPMDMLIGSGSPAPDIGPFRRTTGEFYPAPPHRQGSSSNHMYKLDAAMFPSGDPFEYPSQPLMDLGHPSQPQPQPQPQHRGLPEAHAHHHADSVQQFYGMPPAANVYGDIEGQLLGPIPPYLVQPSHGMGGLEDLAAQMYSASSMISLQQQQQQQQHGGSQRPHNPQPGAGAQMAPAGQHPDMDDILLAQSGYGVFPPHTHYR